MIVETKTIYKCEYCGKLYQRKYFAERHESMCVKNPDNERVCFGCPYLIKKTVSIYFDTYNGEVEENRTLLYCEEKDIYLYPPCVEVKKNWFELGDELNEPMKKECDSHDKWIDELNEVANNMFQ